MSESALSWSSTVPALTSWPDLNSTLRTRPAISVVTSTPRTATIEPTAVSCGCQVRLVACIADTVCGPGFGAEAIRVLMCRKKPKASKATRTSTPPSMMNIRFVMSCSLSTVRMV